LIFVQDYFTDENIIVPLMAEYKDFNYVNYILDLEFKQAFKLFQSCLNSKKEQLEKEVENKYWDLYLLEVENGYKGSFNEYYKSKKKTNEVDNMSSEEKDSEEKRILEKYSSKNKVKNKVVEKVIT
jgi:hypothetical protein